MLAYLCRIFRWPAACTPEPERVPDLIAGEMAELKPMRERAEQRLQFAQAALQTLNQGARVLRKGEVS